MGACLTRMAMHTKQGNLLGLGDALRPSAGLDLGFDRLAVDDLYDDLGRELGRGQFGVVRLVRDKHSGEEVAVKSIKKSGLLDAYAVDDVVREVELLRAVTGRPGVLSLKRVLEDESAVHVVLTAARGGELFDQITKRGFYSEADAAKLVRQILEAVARLHLAGVVHRDLKPENLLFESEAEDSRLLIVDFGLGAFADPAGLPFEDVVGSAYYVAPEVLRKKYTESCDVWSAGIITYILLVGYPPFWAPTETGIFYKILNARVETCGRNWPSVSRDAKDFVTSLLVKNPEGRPSAAQALSHPWLRGGAPAVPLDVGVVRAMAQFAAFTRLKKAALRHVASVLESEAEAQDLHDQFAAMDVDNDGKLTVEELQKGLARVGSSVDGFAIPENVGEELLRALDADGDGTLDYNEFAAAAAHLHSVQLVRGDMTRWRERMRTAFDKLDVNHDGFLDVHELGQLLNGTVDDLQAALQEVDSNGDNLIDFPEFATLLRSSTDPCTALARLAGPASQRGEPTPARPHKRR